MFRTKTLSLTLVSALIAGSVPSILAQAQVEFSLSSDISYRQNKKSMRFFGGSFDQDFVDGSATIDPACSSSEFSPGDILEGCGTNGLVSSGRIPGEPISTRYVSVEGISPAQAVASGHANKVFLNAAPASTLPRPSGGFRDGSFTLFYDLTTTDIREYVLTYYYRHNKFTRKQRSKFESQIVPGAYYYSFPSLKNPDQPAPISATIYPMIEGRKDKNNVPSGFEFSQVNQNKFDKKGFVKLSYLRPNKFEWVGATPATILAGADTGYFSIKLLRNPRRANSAVVEKYQGKPVSIFPPIQNDNEPQVQLQSPFTSSFITAPIFDSGTRGVAQVRYQRSLKTGGISYDYSSRRFQIPVVVVDSYDEYEEIVFRKPGKKTDLLLDTDGDGYNNLNEWALESDANDSASIPIAPVPELVAFEANDLFPVDDSYFGFDVKKKLGTEPKVGYILQVSRNNGKTWRKFRSDAKWSVENVRRAATGSLPPSVMIEVRSLERDDDTGEPVQPRGTVNHIYRVKVILKKNK